MCVCVCARLRIGALCAIFYWEIVSAGNFVYFMFLEVCANRTLSSHTISNLYAVRSLSAVLPMGLKPISITFFPLHSILFHLLRIEWRRLGYYSHQNCLRGAVVQPYVVRAADSQKAENSSKFEQKKK